MSKMGMYNGLNETSKFKIEIDIPELVKMVAGMNYGTHRFLSALVPILREKQEELNKVFREDDPNHIDIPCKLADGIQDLLDQGLY